MKGLIYFVFFIFSFLAVGQSYIDSGIGNYHSNQFEEAVSDFNKAYELRDALQSSAIAKIFLYRGLSKFELLKKEGENAEAGITLQEVYSDISTSLEYGNEWASKVEETKEELFNLVVEYAENSGKLAGRESDFAQKIALLKDRIEYLKIAKELNATSASNLHLGESYKEIGDLYFENAADLATLQLVKGQYEEALKYYEIARYDDPFSKDIINNLLELSKRLDDQARVEEYEKLLKLAGG